jgi:hypothetical protein
MLLTVAACDTSVTRHGVVASKTLDGTGVITIAGTSTMLTQATFDIGDSPVVTGDVSFKFELGDPSATHADINCMPVPWSSVVLGQPTPLASVARAECFIDLTTPDCGRGAELTAPTLTVLASLDRVGNGTLSLELDGSGDATALDVNCNPMQLALHFEMIQLTGTATFHDEHLQDHGGGWPFGG